MLPGVVLFGIGLAIVVAPVTATVLASAPDHHAGVASGVNNAVARTGSLLAMAVLPAAVGLTGDDYADPSVMTDGWQMALVLCAAAAIIGGLLAFGVDNGVLARGSGAARGPASGRVPALRRRGPADAHPLRR